MILRTLILDVTAPDRWLNSNDRLDRRGTAGVAALTRQWRIAAKQYAQAARLPNLTHRVRITATIAFADAEERDTPNYYPTVKACVDGLVDAGVLAGDSDRFVRSLTMEPGPALPAKAYGPTGVITFTLQEVAA